MKRAGRGKSFGQMRSHGSLWEIFFSAGAREPEIALVFFE